jgi:hypothetical protein
MSVTYPRTEQNGKNPGPGPAPGPAEPFLTWLGLGIGAGIRRSVWAMASLVGSSCAVEGAQPAGRVA